jgi:hypothetical protein
MLTRTLRRLGYALVLAYGVMDAVAPRTTLRLKLAPASLLFENVGEIEPRPGYLRAARAAGMGMIVAGATGLALESGSGDDPDAGDAIGED